MENPYKIVRNPDAEDFYDVEGPGGTLLVGSYKSGASDLASKLNAAFTAGYLLRIQEEEQNHKTNTYYKRGSSGLIME